MIPYYDDGQVQLYHGDVRAVLRALPGGSAQCVVTSPPYWALRDYGIEPSVWGGAEACAHEWADSTRQAERYTGKRKWQHIAAEAMAAGVNVRDVDPNAWGHPQKSDTSICTICGAWRGALGLEPTPALFIAHTVEVFREVYRVLRDDGVLWLNIGDSYASGGGSHGGASGLRPERNDLGERAAAADTGFRGSRSRGGRAASPIHADPAATAYEGPNRYPLAGIHAKELIGIPWMLAFAMRDAGWRLRQEVIWHKPNPMPESVTDRCTKAHEHVFLFSKGQRYYWDQDAIREPLLGGARDQAPARKARAHEGQSSHPNAERNGIRPYRSGNGFAGRQGGSERCGPLDGGRGSEEPWEDDGTGRNARSVWTIPTAPYSGAHFATFPPALPERCILAATRPGDTVLDPFVGSGTTAMVARRLGRRAIGVDRSEEYLREHAVKRVGEQLALIGGVE